MYLTNFKSNEDILEQYSIDAKELEGATIHLAWYGYGSYCGSSFVIFEKDGKLFEVNASHCSCNGLEGKWDPEETTWEALKIRDINQYDDGDVGEKEAEEALKALVDAHLPSASPIN